MIHYSHPAGSRVARITFDRPEAGNKIHYPMMKQFIEALHAATRENATVLVIDAKGNDFTLGRDQSAKPPEGVTRLDSLSLILDANKALREFPGVSISLIQGRAFGFGSGVALHSSIAIGTEEIQLGFDEIEHGLAPLVVVAYLPHYIGPRIATELVVTGRKVLAAEALQRGFLNRVVPASDLQGVGEEVVRQVLAQPATAVQLIRRFENSLRTDYPTPETSRRAIVELDAWLAAGRPAIDPHPASINHQGEPA